MTYRVRILLRAKRDVAAAARWYLERSGDIEVSTNWVAGIESAIDSLAHNPERGGIARESDAFEDTIRELSYGSGRRRTHRILFRILEDEKLVEVIAVRHTSQRDVTPEDL